MMNTAAFKRWVMGSAQNLQDVESIIAGTNIEQVDLEHRRLVQYAIDMNASLAALQKQGISWRSINEAQDLLDRLYRYSAYHFESEEDLMYRHGIPGLETMNRQHSNLLRRMQAYQEDFRAGRSFSGIDLKTDIMEWVINHINRVDYDTFAVTSMENILAHAHTWDDIAPFVKNTNIKTVDTDHRAIMDLFLEFNRVLDGEAGPSLVSVLSELLEVTSGHFDREEKLMLRCGAGEIESHGALHRQFEQRLRDCCEHGFTDPDALRKELIAWLVQHINQVDMETFRQGPWLYRLMRESTSADEVLVFLVHLGIPAIDQDHEHFVRSVYELDAILDLDVLPEEKARKLGNGIQNLRSFAQGHFAREEEIMHRTRHPLEHRHHMEHESLLAGLDQYSRDLNSGNVRMGNSIREQLFTWWMGHTNGTDVETFRSWR